MLGFFPKNCSGFFFKLLYSNLQQSLIKTRKISSKKIEIYIPQDLLEHSPDSLITFPEIFDNILGVFSNIPHNLFKHTPEYSGTLQRNFSNIPWILLEHYLESSQTFPGIFLNISRDLFEQSLIVKMLN